MTTPAVLCCLYRIVIITILILGLVFCYFISPFDLDGRNILIAYERLRNGYEIEVRQRWGQDFYTSVLWIKSPVHGWGWVVIDPDALKWRDCRIVSDVDSGTVMVMHLGRERARFIIDRNGALHDINPTWIGTDLWSVEVAP